MGTSSYIVFSIAISGLLFVNAIFVLIYEANYANINEDKANEESNRHSIREENAVDSKILNIKVMHIDIQNRFDSS